MAIITPTILEYNLLDFDEKLLIVQRLCSRIQIDIIDGDFVENKTPFPEEWPQFGSNLSIDAHLMVLEPESWVSRLKNKQIDLIVGQYEGMGSLKKFFKECNDAGKKIGIALDIDTPVTAIDSWMIPDLSAVVLMAIKTGFSGQAFDLSVLPKIKAMRQIIGYTAEIIIDGGINLETAKSCVEAGADVLACNSFFWQNPEENLKKLSNL